MKVLHFYKTYYPETLGGVEQLIYQICKGVEQQGITSEVLTLSSAKNTASFVWENHVVHRAPLDFELASSGFSLSAFQKFAKLARQVDVIHYHYPWPFMDMVHFATHVKKPTIVTYHSDIVRQKQLLRLYSPLKNCFLKSVDRIIATSPNYVETSDVLKLHFDKTTVIPIGLDKSTYPKPSLEVIESWRSRVGDRFFLFVGSMRYYKGLHILLEAIQGTNLPVVIVGSGPLENELKDHACRLALANVHFVGALPDHDKIALLMLCYAIAFPSHLRSEAFGISLLEGAMFGKPMISCEIGTGTSYININGETGLVVTPNDPSAFREAMLFLRGNPAIATSMGMRAEKRYKEFFTAQKMAESYANIYQQLMNQSH